MLPPSSNTGGKSPLEAPGPSSRTKVDALAFSARGSRLGVLGLLESALESAGEVGISQRKAGWQGFEEAVEVLVDEASVGLVAWGGQSQNGAIYASLMGTGCALARDLQPLVAHCESREWALKRVDLAADIVDGSVGFDTIIQAHRDGKFQRGGRRPKLDGFGPLDGSDRGRTVTVGDRKSDVFFRGYEKGLKELNAFCDELAPELARDAWWAAQFEVDGVMSDPRKWFRCELELKAKKRPIPYDVVARRDHYFAGAYPFLAELLPAVEPEQIITPEKQGELALHEALAHVRRQWGAMLYTAQMANGGDAMAVWEKIVGKKHSESLVRAGALLGKLPETTP